MTLLADTSGILASLDVRDPHHTSVAELLVTETLLVPSMILPEVDYLARKNFGDHAAQAFLDDVEDGTYTFVPTTLQHLKRANEIMRQYADVPLSVVDAAVIAVAENVKVRRVLTLDRRHFSLIRPRGLPFLELLP